MAIARSTYIFVSIAAILIGISVSVRADESSDPLNKINHIVVIYQENHSFDNLYGGWEGVNGLGTNGVVQVNQTGTAFGCLMQNDVNLTSPPLATTCTDTANSISSHFVGAPFSIENFIKASDTTCPPPGTSAPNGIFKNAKDIDGKPAGLPGGCTSDIVHRFYQHQYQIDSGKMDRFVVGSDVFGLTMGYYDTHKLPIYEYLHRPKHPHYVIADNFFQAAFGGSFLNHQWLVAAHTPEWVGAYNDGTPLDQHSVVDINGMPSSYPPLYSSPSGNMVGDRALTASCAPASTRGPTIAGVVCGDYAVNTIQPMSWPYQFAKPGTFQFKNYNRLRLPLLTSPTIGDRLTGAGIDWAWYSGGWANAEGDLNQPGYTNGEGPVCTDPKAVVESTWPKCPDKLFQFHHQPLNYFANFAFSTEARKMRLRDEIEFIQLARASNHSTCNLKAVSFVKPLGAENEHPGYASEHQGNDHLVDLVQTLVSGSCIKDTLIIVAYDEFGGQADHVAPPGPGNSKGPHDQWGPGSRIPVLIIAPNLRNDFAVDHTVYDTTSILATIEHRFHLSPLGSRDASVNDLSAAFRADNIAPDFNKR